MINAPYKQTHHPIIALTCGDMNSIAPLITSKAWLKLKNTPYNFVLLSNMEYMEKVIKYFGLNIKIAQVHTPQEAQGLFSNYLPIINIDFAVKNFLGDKTLSNSEITMQSLDMAIALCKKNDIQGFCTNPLDKNLINQYLAPSISFHGHTQYIADAFNNSTPLMILSNITQTLKVLPLTTHIPISKVAKSLSKEFIIKNVLALNQSLIRQFNIKKPKIGILGLNPHCGDGGIMGNEELDFINGSIVELQNMGIDAIGSIPADTAFTPLHIQKYDCIVGMYHDQVLAPFKTLYFDEGVNVTANLDYIRTSPDHGVAFDIANTANATPHSLINALKLCTDMINIKNHITS